MSNLIDSAIGSTKITAVIGIVFFVILIGFRWAVTGDFFAYQPEPNTEMLHRLIVFFLALIWTLFFITGLTEKAGEK